MLEWHPAPGKDQPKTKEPTALSESVSAPPRSRKGKKKVVEDDPIENDDMYDMDDEPMMDEAQNRPIVITSRSTRSAADRAFPLATSANQQASSMSEHSDSATVLYQQMLALRNEVCPYHLLPTEVFTQPVLKIITKHNISEDEVLPDYTLQMLSATCPTGTRSLHRILACYF